MSKDKGKDLYEADVAAQPVYTATGKPRPKWHDLSEHARDAWRAKVPVDAGE